MEEVKTIVLEDGLKYFLLDELEVDGTKYYVLANMNDYKDIVIRKQEFENGEEFIATLDSEAEVTKVLAHFAHKHKN